MAKKNQKKVVILRKWRNGSYTFLKYNEALAMRNLEALKREGYEIYEEKKIEIKIEAIEENTILNQNQIENELTL
jgi:hypothetical protein